MIDIYLIPINQLLVQRCGENGGYARALLLNYRNEVITAAIVDQRQNRRECYVWYTRKTTYRARGKREKKQRLILIKPILVLCFSPQRKMIGKILFKIPEKFTYQ